MFHTIRARTLLALACGAALWGGTPARAQTPATQPACRFAQEPGKTLSLQRGPVTLWTLHFDKSDSRPFLHPLRTLDGDDLTALQPPDHIWHFGLWFSWKFINSKNYWEIDPQTRRSQGLSEIRDARITTSPTGATAVLEVSYHLPDQPELLHETRTCTFGLPDSTGRYRIDFHHVFTAGDQPLTLDRTKPPSQGGPFYGGYGGLAYRCAKQITHRCLLDSTGWQHNDKTLWGRGEKAAWCDFSGTPDAAGQKPAGVAIFDHPTNPRHPTPWYVSLDHDFGYMNPAPLFHEPLTLRPGERLVFFYRVLVHPGYGDAAALNAEFKTFSDVKPPAPATQPATQP